RVPEGRVRGEDMEPEKTRMQTFSKQLRQSSTDAERKMWSLLRSRRFAGYKFRRQEVIGPFIVDFTCFKRRLVIELDGGQHVEKQDMDDRRTERLNEMGFQVLRFWNDQIFKDIEAVVDQIWKRLHQSPLTLPSPALRGEREKRH